MLISGWDILICVTLACLCCVMFLLWQERRGWRPWLLGLLFIGGGLSLLLSSIYILSACVQTRSWDPALREAAMGWFAQVPYLTWFFTGLAGLTMCAGRLHAIFLHQRQRAERRKPEIA